MSRPLPPSRWTWGRVTLIAVTTIAGVLYLYARLVLPLQTGRELSGGYDFQAYYHAAQRVQRGEPLYDFDRNWPRHDGTTALPYLYPPLLAALLQPLARLPLDSARTVWATLNYALLFVTVVLLSGLRSPWRREVLVCTTVLLTVTCLPLGFAIELGQVNVLVLALLALGLRASERDQWPLAAVALSLAALLKLTPLLPLLFLCRQRPRVTLVPCLLVVTALSLLAAGPTGDFLRRLPALADPEQNFNVTNQSLGAFVDRLLISNERVTPLANAPLCATVLGQVGRVALLVLFVALCWRSSPNAIARQLGFGLAILLALLLPRITWVHHHVWCVVPMLATLNALAWLRGGARASAALVLAASAALIWLPPVWLLEGVYQALRQRPGGALWLSYPFCGILLLLILDTVLFLRLPAAPENAPTRGGETLDDFSHHAPAAFAAH